MTDPRYIGTILYVGLAIFAALLAAGLLMQERRWSVQRTALLWGAEGLILLLDLYLCFGLLPAPLRLPVSLTVGFLSYSAVFIAVSADGFWKKVYLLITFFCVCCISWSGGLYLCYFLLPDRPMAVKYLVRTALHIVTALPILLAYRKYGRPLLREVSGFRKQSWKLLSAVSAIYFFLFIALMSRIRLDDGVEPDTLFAFCAAVCTYAAVSVLSIGNIFLYAQRRQRSARQAEAGVPGELHGDCQPGRAGEPPHPPRQAASRRLHRRHGARVTPTASCAILSRSRRSPRTSPRGARTPWSTSCCAPTPKRRRRRAWRSPRRRIRPRSPTSPTWTLSPFSRTFWKTPSTPVPRRTAPAPSASTSETSEKDGPRGEQPLRQLEAGKRPVLRRTAPVPSASTSETSEKRRSSR